MFEHIKNYIINLGFIENNPSYFVKDDITIVYAENAYHLSFYLKPIGNVTLVNKIEENSITETKIDSFIESVNYIKNKLY